MNELARFCRLMARPAAWKRLPSCLPALVALGGDCGGGHSLHTLRSLTPAVRDVDALEMPSIVGRWGTPPDTTSLEIRRSAERTPSYVFVAHD